MTAYRRLLVLGLRIALGVAIVGGWQLVGSQKWIDPFFISEPTLIVDRLLGWIRDGSILTNAFPTLAEACVGFVISAVAGIVIGLLLARFPLIEDVTRPFIDVLNTIPRIALAPLFVLWFGLAFKAKIVLVISVVVFSFIINTFSGVTSVDQDLLRMARTLGGNRIDLIRRIVLPSIAPWLMAAARLGVAYSLAAAVVAEIVSASSGLGYLIAYSSGTLDTDGEFAALVVLATLGWVANATLALAERRMFRWRNEQMQISGM